MISKYHNHTLQTDPQHCEEETETDNNSHKTLGRQSKAALLAQFVERPLLECEVGGSNPTAAPYQRCKKFHSHFHGNFHASVTFLFLFGLS